MDITKLNVWLGVVANLSVIAGIVFLGFELRQTSLDAATIHLELGLARAPGPDPARLLA